MWHRIVGLPLANHAPLMSGSVPARAAVSAAKAIAMLAQIAKTLAMAHL